MDTHSAGFIRYRLIAEISVNWSSVTTNVWFNPCRLVVPIFLSHRSVPIRHKLYVIHFLYGSLSCCNILAHWRHLELASIADLSIYFRNYHIVSKSSTAPYSIYSPVTRSTSFAVKVKNDYNEKLAPKTFWSANSLINFFFNLSLYSCFWIVSVLFKTITSRKFVQYKLFDRLEHKSENFSLVTNPVLIAVMILIITVCIRKSYTISLIFCYLQEHKRIQDAGGFISFNGVWRVAGILATSRAIGW